MHMEHARLHIVCGFIPLNTTIIPSIVILCAESRKVTGRIFQWVVRFNQRLCAQCMGGKEG